MTAHPAHPSIIGPTLGTAVPDTRHQAAEPATTQLRLATDAVAVDAKHLVVLNQALEDITGALRALIPAERLSPDERNFLRPAFAGADIGEVAERNDALAALAKHHLADRLTQFQPTPDQFPQHEPLSALLNSLKTAHDFIGRGLHGYVDNHDHLQSSSLGTLPGLGRSIQAQVGSIAETLNPLFGTVHLPPAYRARLHEFVPAAESELALIRTAINTVQVSLQDLPLGHAPETENLWGQDATKMEVLELAELTAGLHRAFSAWVDVSPELQTSTEIALVAARVDSLLTSLECFSLRAVVGYKDGKDVRTENSLHAFPDVARRLSEESGQLATFLAEQEAAQHSNGRGPRFLRFLARASKEKAVKEKAVAA